MASSKDFHAMGYYVQKGQEAITITLPHREGIFRDAAGTKKLVQHANQQEKQAIIDDRIQTHLVTTHFQSIPVYDITQTNCPPEIFWKLYPEVRANFSFDQTEENYEWFEKALYQYIKEKEFIVRFDSVQNSKKLKYVIGKNEVIIDNQLSLKERTELLVRELARAELENYRQVTLEKDSVEVMEFKENQKEMAAYVVSKSLGMEKEDYTQSYLMNWQPKAIKDEIYIRMLEEVKETSLSLVDVLVKKFNTLKDSK